MKRRTIISISVCAALTAGLTLGRPNAYTGKSHFAAVGQRAALIDRPSLLGGFDSTGSLFLPPEQPDLRIEKERTPRINSSGTPMGDFDEDVKFTNVGQSRITIRDVLINGKKHCAKLGNVSDLEPPVTLLELGGWSNFRFVCSGTVAEVRIVTNRGNSTYSFK